MKIKSKQWLIAIIVLALTACGNNTHVADYTLIVREGENEIHKGFTGEAVQLRGITWNGTTRTLTLSNFSFTTYSNNGLVLPHNSTIVLNGTNTIRSTNTNTSSNNLFSITTGISGTNLTIEGRGSLTVTSGTDERSSTGIMGMGTLTISRAVEKLAKTNNYGIVKEYCGHGVGFELHEDPHVPNYPHGANPKLKNGMVFAIEPMINLGTGDIEVLDDEWTVVTADEKVSAHWEHTIAIIGGKTEVLTAPLE